MALQVTLDVFSGRENPNWVLDSAQEAEFLSLLNSLEPASGEAPQPPGLGYRGFVVGSRAEGLWSSVRVYGGAVQQGDETYEDTGRQLEQWLLRTSGTSVSQEVTAKISQELLRS